MRSGGGGCVSQRWLSSGHIRVARREFLWAGTWRSLSLPSLNDIRALRWRLQVVARAASSALSGVSLAPNIGRFFPERRFAPYALEAHDAAARFGLSRRALPPAAAVRNVRRASCWATPRRDQKENAHRKSRARHLARARFVCVPSRLTIRRR